MTDSPEPPVRGQVPLFKRVRFLFAITATVVLASLLVYVLINPHWSGDRQPPDGSPDDEDLSVTYSQENVSELCDELDLRAFEDMTGVEPTLTSTKTVCDMVSNGSGSNGFGLRVEVAVWSSDKEAVEDFGGAAQTDEAIVVSGNWDAAITYPSVEDPALSYLEVLDDNMTITIRWSADPAGTVSEADSVELMTVYAQQTQDAYRD